MRIYDPLGKQIMSACTVYLTRDEVKELASMASSLAAHSEGHHDHLVGADYMSQLTIAVYTKTNLGEFDPESVAVLRGRPETPYFTPCVAAPPPKVINGHPVPYDLSIEPTHDLA
ncbi:MAG: hypothetical protein HY814_06660 [Candidatus Riflebacteria bacterium]|nr:hypothetical protein [Candidatus Riflebacteria bacterium]